MNAKTLIGAIIAGAVSFLLGWLVYGNLLMDFYAAHSIHYDGLAKDPPDLLMIGVANLAFGLLMAYIFSIGKIRSIAGGVTTGIIVVALSAAGTGLLNYGLMHLSSLKLVGVDVAIHAVMGAIIGAVLGWWFSRGAATV